MATLQTLYPCPRPRAHPSRPRMNSILTLVTPEKHRRSLATLPGPAPAARSCAVSPHLLRTGHWRQVRRFTAPPRHRNASSINGQHTLIALVQEQVSPG